MSFLNVSPIRCHRPQYSEYFVDVEWSQRFRKQVPVPRAVAAAPPPYTPTSTGGSAGGFAVPRDPVAPRGANPKLWAYFLMVDVDRSGSTSAPELQSALVNGDWTRTFSSALSALGGHPYPL